MEAEAQSRSKTQRKKTMKTRKITETYAVMSLGQIRQIARLAESSALAMYGHAEQKHCIILRGPSVKLKGKVQFSPEAFSGAGQLIPLTWQE